MEAIGTLNGPNEMLRFALSRAIRDGPRLGSLQRLRGPNIQTPHYVAVTSRGSVPHVSPDNLRRHTKIQATYHSLEDFIEKAPEHAPLLKTPVTAHRSPLREYVALPDEIVSILGPRRIPPIACPAHNNSTGIAISTSVGFRQLEVEAYIEASKTLKPDITVSIADDITREKSSVKRQRKSGDRTHVWLRDHLGALESSGQEATPLFASVPAVEAELQSFYLSGLADDFRSRISGVSLSDRHTLDVVPVELESLPRLCLSDPPSPQAVLQAILVGVDLITVPFVSRASEYGIALTFALSHVDGEGRKALGLNLWSIENATDLSPLTPDCACYTCQRHHRAYVHHLLSAKEMLGWTLLQLHNFTIMDAFFADVRSSISHGTLERDVASFDKAYEPDLPQQTGEGPRVRGYQMKSIGGGEPRKNAKAYGRLDDRAQKLAEAEAGLATPTLNSEELQNHGFGKTAE